MLRGAVFDSHLPLFLAANQNHRAPRSPLAVVCYQLFFVVRQLAPLKCHVHLDLFSFVDIPHRDVLFLRDWEIERSHLTTHVVSDPARLEVL